jgi:hypothetical protein
MAQKFAEFGREDMSSAVRPMAIAPDEQYMFVTDDYVNVRDNTATAIRALYNHHEWGTTR